MKNYAITSGKFTNKKNFTGYTAKGIRVHIHEAQMLALKWASDAEVKFPFYAVAEVRIIGQLGEDNKPLVVDGVPVTAERLTAGAVFATKEALVNASVDELTLDLSIAAEVQKQATASGLSEGALAKVFAASVA